MWSLFFGSFCSYCNKRWSQKHAGYLARGAWGKMALGARRAGAKRRPPRAGHRRALILNSPSLVWSFATLRLRYRHTREGRVLSLVIFNALWSFKAFSSLYLLERVTYSFSDLRSFSVVVTFPHYLRNSHLFLFRQTFPFRYNACRPTWLQYDRNVMLLCSVTNRYVSVEVLW